MSAPRIVFLVALMTASTAGAHNDLKLELSAPKLLASVPLSAPTHMSIAAPGRRTTWMLITGPIVFGVSWLTTVGITAVVSVATGSSRSGLNISYTAVPVFGPLLLLLDPDRDTWAYSGPLMSAAVLQAGGVVLTILGFRGRSAITNAPAVAVAPLGGGGLGLLWSGAL